MCPAERNLVIKMRNELARLWLIPTSPAARIGTVSAHFAYKTRRAVSRGDCPAEKSWFLNRWFRPQPEPG